MSLFGFIIIVIVIVMVGPTVKRIAGKIGGNGIGGGMGQYIGPIHDMIQNHTGGFNKGDDTDVDGIVDSVYKEESKKPRQSRKSQYIDEHPDIDRDAAQYL